MVESSSQKPGCLGFLQKLLGTPTERVEADGCDESWPLTQKPGLLSDAEFSFYRVLQQACGERWAVCPKVNMADLLTVQRGVEKPATYRNKFDRKHIDFVLCDTQTMAVVAAVELDDASHDRASSKKRDAIKDKACKDAGLTLLRFRAQRSYDPATIGIKLSKL